MEVKYFAGTVVVLVDVVEKKFDDSRQELKCFYLAGYTCNQRVKDDDGCGGKDNDDYDKFQTLSYHHIFVYSVVDTRNLLLEIKMHKA